MHHIGIHKKNKGMGLVEIVIGSAIIVTGLLALSTAYITYMKYALANQYNIQAAYLAEEALEVVTFFRDSSWNGKIKNMVVETPLYVNWTGGTWATSTIPLYIDERFNRYITLSNVNRDNDGKITAWGGTYDQNTKKITVTVEYPYNGATTTKSFSTYIANIYAN